MKAPKNFRHIDNQEIRFTIGNNTVEYQIDMEPSEVGFDDIDNDTEHGVFVIPCSDEYLNVLYFKIVWTDWVYGKDYDVNVHIVPIGYGKRSIDNYIHRISLKDVESKYAFINWIKRQCQREDGNLRTLTKSPF